MAGRKFPRGVRRTAIGPYFTNHGPIPSFQSQTKLWNGKLGYLFELGVYKRGAEGRTTKSVKRSAGSSSRSVTYPVGQRILAGSALWFARCACLAQRCEHCPASGGV